MKDRPAEVRNAADEGQVKAAGKRVRKRETRRLAQYRAVMSTPAGRAVISDLIRSAGVYETTIAGSGAFLPPVEMMIWRTGRQDFGRKLMATVIEAAPDLYELMEREYRDRLAKDTVETEAAHTPSAEEGEHTDG